MSTDLDQLLREASGDPATPLDPDELWRSGRRRRWLRHAGAATTAVAVVLAVVVARPSLVGVQVPEIAPAQQGDSETEATAQPSPTATEPTADDDPSPASEPEDEPESEPEPSVEAESEGEAGADAGPQPDAAAVEDPCADHQGREAESFLDVVAPVDGQQVEDSVDLVGCSNVYEANVRYRVTGSGGEVLVDGFTTAECGSGCVGAFRETVDLEGASGELTLEVFWDSPASGEGEQDTTRLTLDAG